MEASKSLAVYSVLPPQRRARRARLAEACLEEQLSRRLQTQEAVSLVLRILNSNSRVSNRQAQGCLALQGERRRLAQDCLAAQRRSPSNNNNNSSNRQLEEDYSVRQLPKNRRSQREEACLGLPGTLHSSNHRRNHSSNSKAQVCSGNRKRNQVYCKWRKLMRPSFEFEADRISLVVRSPSNKLSKPNKPDQFPQRGSILTTFDHGHASMI